MKINKKVKLVFFSPFIRIIVGLIVYLSMVALVQTLLNLILSYTTISHSIGILFKGILTASTSLLTYIYLFKKYENREISELLNKSIFKSMTCGTLLGFVLHALTILVMYMFGDYTIISFNPISIIGIPIVTFLTSSIFEEILVRGVIFRIAEQKLGSYYALLISALLFGAMHLGNPNSNYIVAIGLAIQAGLLLGASYIYAKNLWFPIAIHFAWNTTQSAIFGASVSGNKMTRSFINSRIEGSDWITGGAFGPEGSVQATLFCFIVALILIYLSRKQGKIIKPSWR